MRTDHRERTVKNRRTSSPGPDRPRFTGAATSARLRAAALVAAGLLVPAILATGAGPADAATSWPSVSKTISLSNDSQPQAVAVDPDTNMVYVAAALGGANDGGASHGILAVIDGATGVGTAAVNVGRDANAVAVDPATNTVYVANGLDKSLSVISGSTDQVTATITLGGDPVGVAVNPVTDMVYATWGDNDVTVINGATNAFVTNVIVGFDGADDPELADPTGIDVNTATNEIFVAGWGDKGGSLTAINGATNSVDSVGWGCTNPDQVAVDPATNITYVSCHGDGYLAGWHGSNVGPNTIVISTGSGGGLQTSGVAVDPITDTVFSTDAGTGKLYMTGLGGTNTHGGYTPDQISIPVGMYPTAVAVDPVTDTAWVTNLGDSTVSEIVVPSIAVKTPGTQQFTAGRAVQLQVSASDPVPGQTMTFSATGLPGGLAINAATGVISGIARNTFQVRGTARISVTDGGTLSGSTGFSWIELP